MNSHMRIRTGLLSRVSTLALLAAAGSLGSTQQAQAACLAPLNVTTPTTITGTHSCVVATDVTGNVINNATVGAPGDGDAGFFVGKGGILGTLTNNNVIAGGGAGGEGSDVLGALTIITNVSGGVVNTGIISSYSGNGIQLGSGTSDSGSYAAMTGTITNSGAITSTLGDGVAAILGSTTGGLVNTDDHTISGGNRGVYIADDFTSWGGGIQNAGEIQGAAAGIQIGDIGGEGSVAFSGGITNEYGGTINSLTGPTIAVNGSTFSGGISNGGVITQRDLAAAGGEGSYAGVGIVVFAETFNDGIYNTGTIDGLGGPAIWVTSDTSAFNGGIENYGRISGVDNGILIESDEFNGNLINRSSGSITSDAFTGDAIYADTDWTGNFDNQGLIQSGLFGNGFDFEGDSFAGNFTNGDRLFGGKNGSGVVFGNSDTDISDGAEGSAQFRNTGTISGEAFGVRILGDTVAMDFTNDSSNPSLYDPGLISADSGAALLLSAANWTGTITNDGTIRGGAVAMLVGGDFDDGFSADPTNIDQVTNSFTGDITNNGVIIADTESASVGLYVTANTFTGNIHNTSSGIIRGNETGAYIEANTFDGDIINDGLIEGLGLDTGLHIVTGTHTGDIINNGILSASGNALHLEIGSLTGSIVNTGTIQVNAGNDAVLLDIASDATFVNTDGGLILGDVALNDILFNGKASHSFIGEDGGIVGSIVGDPDSFGGEGGPVNDDFVIVRNGTQYFLDDGAEGLSGLSDLAAFNVNSGGTAVMGASFIGDTNGTGYTSNNVDALNVNAGGTLYIDKQTELNVGSYTQSADGTLTYFLQAPGSSPSSLASPSLSVQSTAIATPGVDYGQIFVDGVATLNGSISAYLDPSSFATTLYDEIIYNDVIDATGGISGDFTNVELFSNSSIFQLSHVIDGNTVDLTVARTSLAHLGGLAGIVIETAGPWKSMVNDRSNGIGSGSCGLAGGGWCFNRFAANEPGATSVMTDATPGDDPFAWLRTGVRRVGETAAWGRLVGVIGETDGDIGVAGTDFQLAGAIAGIDHVFTPILLAGAAAQFTTQDIDFDGRPDNAQVDSFELGAYMSYGDTRLYLNANASFIWHDIDVNRFVGADVANGKYNGTTISGYAEGGKIFETEQGIRIQPLVAISYAHLETDGYSETGPAVTKLDVFGSEFDSLKGMLGARFAYPIQMDSGRKLVPEARIIWSHEFMDDQSSFIADAQGGPFLPQLVTGEQYSRDTIILGTGLTAPLSDATSLFFDYDAGLNEDVTTHTLSAGFRTRW